MSHHARRWIYNEGTLIGGSRRTGSSSFYSLREVILERGSVLVVDLSDGEFVEGPAVQGVEFETKIEEDPSELRTNLRC